MLFRSGQVSKEGKKAARVQIVKSRAPGKGGYINVGRGTVWGNPYVEGMMLSLDGPGKPLRAITLAECVAAYEVYISTEEGWKQQFDAAVQRLLYSDWDFETNEPTDRLFPGGVITIACPGNCLFKANKHNLCHATIIKDRIERAIIERDSKTAS